MVDVGVHSTPYTAARALLDWAIELWPYVNGRALTVGIRLGELFADDMLDVIHFFFDDDSAAASVEGAQLRNQVRKNTFEMLYKSTYSYALKDEKDGYNYSDGNTLPSDGYYDGDDEEEIKPFDPEREPLKPFIPPTEFDENSGLPLNNTILDAPLK